MRESLLGLRLPDAVETLRREGIDPQVTLTAAPRRREAQEGELRVVYASDDGRRLTAARFLNPIAFRGQENA
ncbi:MAG: hypothetical protein PUH70_01130 [Clostridiales bacterium]|nr:hypothetical protein [Clostridiales bacterium]MDY5350486.1 hypothetical protein [Candidatus Ventricola sp.]MDY5515540.1 hypothetical protein [Candidatus Ventricola sp.]